MTDNCAICFEDITAATGRVETSCAHRFHFSCLSSWFIQRIDTELDQSCPCCRTAAGEKERLSTESDAEEGDEDSDDESEGSHYYEEDEQLWLVRAELDDLLKNRLGGTGVPDSLWFHFFNPDGEDRLNPAIRLCFARGEVRTYAISQGGRDPTDEEWDELLERYGEEPGDDASEASAADEEEEEEEGEPVQQIRLSHHQLEDDIVWPNGGIGITPEQWEALSGGEPTAVFTRARLDDLLMLEEIQRSASHPLTDEEWAALFARFAEVAEEDEEQTDEEPADQVVAEEPLPTLRVLWRRRADGTFQRQVLNPEEQEPAEWGEASEGPPPDDLVILCSAAAKKLQALWRGHKQRQVYYGARGLIALSLSLSH